MEDKVTLVTKKRKADFASWTSLITEVEEVSADDIGKLSTVYESFLSEFPLCFIYWRKFVYHKACLCGVDKAVEVYEHAVREATFCVDLWADYCGFAMKVFEDPKDVMRLFERGLSFVGKDYLCHILWDKYIEFEYSLHNWSNLAHIYIRTLKFPTKKLHFYYDRFKKLIASWEEELERQNIDLAASGEAEIAHEVSKSNTHSDSEVSEIISTLFNQPANTVEPYMLNKYISLGEDFYYRSSELYESIRRFETAIHRPYFLAKQLDDNQIKNWHCYLDFVEMQGDFDWTVKLYERCLIPCANYQEFWIRYAEHMEARGGREIASIALEKASKSFMKSLRSYSFLNFLMLHQEARHKYGYFHIHKYWAQRFPNEDANFHYYHARFMERMGDHFSARASLTLAKLDSSSNFLDNVVREANMEKRLGNVEAASLIYKNAIILAEEKQDVELLSFLYIHFARFTFLVKGSIDASREILTKGILKASDNKPLLEELIQFVIAHGGSGQISFVGDVVASALTRQSGLSETLSLTDRVDISLSFIKFVDLYGTIDEVEKAWHQHRKLFPHLLRPESLYVSNDIQDSSTAEKHSNTSCLVMHPPSSSSPRANDISAFNKHLPRSKENSFVASDLEAGKLAIEDDEVIPREVECPITSQGAGKACQEKVIELPGEFNDSGDEGHFVVQNSCKKVSPSIFHLREHECSPSESSNGISTPAFERLSINSPLEGTLTSQIGSTSIVNVLRGENLELRDNSMISDFSESNQDHMKSKMSASAGFNTLPPHVTKDSNYVKTKSTPPLKEKHPRISHFPDLEESHGESSIPSLGHTKMNPDYMTTSSSKVQTQAFLPTEKQEGRFLNQSATLDSHNVESGENSLQIADVSEYVLKYQQNPSSGQQVYPSEANPQIFSVQGYQAQQYVRQDQIQQYSQEQGQYMMSNSQIYQSGIYPYLQSPHQQGFLAAYQQQGMPQVFSESQAQLYHQAMQSDGQYGYFQNGQGFPPQLWYYYQQQIYQLQLQQQNLSLQQQNLQLQHEQQMKSEKLQPKKCSSSQQLHKQDQVNLPHKQQQQTEYLQNLQCQQQQEVHKNNQPPQMNQNYQLQQQPPLGNQTNHQLQQLQQQQVILQQQQQLVLQQQQYQLYLQEKQSEHPQHSRQMQITPLEIQALSEKYLQGQVSSFKIADHPEPDCSSSQMLNS